MNKRLFLEKAKKEKIDNELSLINKSLENCNLSNILEKNDYEKLVPYNLWFRHPKYSVSFIKQNEQLLRVRYYNNIILTPILSTKNSFGAISKFISSMTIYQPYYPETFYFLWEFFQIGYLNSNNLECLFILKEHRLGSLEALLVNRERKGLIGKYDCWISGFDKINMDFLGQNWNVNYLTSENQLTNYDFVYIDVIDIFDSIRKWENENQNCQATIFYLLFILSHMKRNSCMIIRLSLNMHSYWNVIFDIAKEHFQEYTFFRPTTINCFNPEIFIFLNIFSKSKKNLSRNIIQSLYKQNIHDLFYCYFYHNDNNPILKEFIQKRKEWINELKENANNIQLSGLNPSYLGDWCIENNLSQIKTLTDSLNMNEIIMDITNSKSFKFQMKSPELLGEFNEYIELLEKRNELNFYKRFMDTRPSNIYSDNRYRKRNNIFLSWEDLTNAIDPFRNLKDIIRNNYEGEMVTNAWLKMYEMIDMFMGNSKKFTSFHICESPGAFISCINHATFNKNMEHYWMAQSLKPNEKTNLALEDHFGLIEKHSDKWLFGDITKSSTIKNYVSLSFMESVDLITADGGIPFSPKELNYQEEKMTKLLLGQAICILACLPKRKSAILKAFLPLSEPFTISLVYLLTSHFSSVKIMKPSTSNSANSEIYLLLFSYNGISKSLLEILYEILDNPKVNSQTLLCNIRDEKFMESYCRITRFLISRQIQSISRCFYYYYNPNEISKIVMLENNWLEKHPIDKLHRFLLK
jgi:23S rRNA U2552 (ribose-2'-O)-methylase RlmE/FtsJ